jgi:hypothetical protein
VQARGVARAEAASCRGRTRARVRAWREVGEGPDRQVPPGSEGGRERGLGRWVKRPPIREDLKVLLY